jgi:hypothetical protein
MSNKAALTRAIPAEQPPVEVLRLPAQDRQGQRPSLKSPLLVDGSDPTVLEGPLRLAEVLARRDQVKVHVLAVVKPLPPLRSLGASLATGLDFQEIDECRRKVARARARARVREHVGLSAFFGTSSALGPRVATLAAAVRSDSAAYVLNGLPLISPSGRKDKARIASGLAVGAGIPVLAVPRNVHLLPRSVLAAVDGGEASFNAARAALPLLGEGGRVTLLHVVASPSLPDRRDQVEHRVMDDLRKLAKEIGASADTEVNLVVVQGDPLRHVAQRTSEFDLVTLGASSSETLDQAPETSVSTVAFEHAHGALLVAPAVRETTFGRQQVMAKAESAESEVGHGL